MNANQHVIIDLLNALPLSDYAPGGELSTTVRALLDNKAREWYKSDEYAKKCQADAERNNKKRLTAAERANHAQRWALKNLKVGMYVKMSGTRDGVGLRKVVAIEKEHVVCRKIEPVWRNDIVSHKYDELFQVGGKWYHVMHDATTHGMEKVTHFFKENNGKYVLTPLPI